MKFAAAILVGATLLGSAPIFADNSMMSSQTAEQKKMMKDCMASEKAKDSKMSKEDMKKACMDKMKADSSKMPATAPK